MSLCVAYITSRHEPRIEWFYDSLRRQNGQIDQMIVVDTFADMENRKHNFQCDFSKDFTHTAPKPTVWQGKHKLTKENWWAVSNARNTALCLCRCDWIALVDDRCVLLPGWLNAVKQAIKENYAVFGSYEKRWHMRVENGVIKESGKPDAADVREDTILKHRNAETPASCPGDWSFGCNLALPLKWALQVNGYDETCDGISMEDTLFGRMLENNRYDMKYDRWMKVIQDRTPGETGPAMIRKDKGVSPNDKSHALLKKLWNATRATHPWNLWKLRESALRGLSWPIPKQPDKDWYDGQPLKEM